MAEKLGFPVRLCLRLNACFRPHSNLKKLIEDPSERGLAGYMIRSAENHCSAALHFLDLGRLKRSLALNVGCGYGGLEIAFAARGVRRVIGLDRQVPVLSLAGQIFRERFPGRQGNFTAGDGGRLPFADSSLDVIFSIAAMEHIADPQRFLDECRRALRPGGQVYLAFSPYYASNGAHLFDFIHIPWCHLLFSEKTLVRAWKQLARRQPLLARWNSSVDAEAERLTGLNRITVRRLRVLLAGSGLTVSRYRERSYHRRFVRWLRPLPVLRELLTSEITVVMEKN